MGTIFAFFQSSGKVPVLKDCLNIRYRNLLEICIVPLSNFALMSSQPADDDILRERIKLVMPSRVICISGIVLGEKLGKGSIGQELKSWKTDVKNSFRAAAESLTPMGSSLASTRFIWLVCGLVEMVRQNLFGFVRSIEIKSTWKYLSLASFNALMYSASQRRCRSHAFGLFLLFAVLYRRFFRFSSDFKCLLNHGLFESDFTVIVGIYFFFKLSNMFL